MLRKKARRQSKRDTKDRTIARQKKAIDRLRKTNLELESLIDERNDEIKTLKQENRRVRRDLRQAHEELERARAQAQDERARLGIDDGKLH